MKVIKSIKQYSLLIKNFSYLTILKVATMILPLATYPYLIKVLGISNYGLLVYSQAVIGYFVIFINFGFNITTTRDISINRHDINKLSEIISATYFIKIVFFIVSVLVLYLLKEIFADIYDNFSLFLFTLLWLASYEVFFPVYYFQGTENMKYITIITLISRLVFFVLIFVLIKKEEDYILFPIINFIGSLVGIFFVFYILVKNGIRFYIPNKQVLLYHIKNSYIMGIAVGANSFKSNLNIILLKNFLSFNEVALFDLAMKIVNIGITFTDIISQTVFPKLAKEKNKVFFKKIIKLVNIFSWTCVLGIIIFGSFLISFLGNNKLDDSYQILIIISLVIPIYSLGTILGRNGLNVHGLDKYVLYSMIYSSLAYLICFVVSTYIFGIKLNVYTFVVFYLLSFFIDTLYRYFKCKKYNII